MFKAGKVISADTDNFVRYCKYKDKYAVVKALHFLNDDTPELYEKEIKTQEKLYNLGVAPKLLTKYVKLQKKDRVFVGWISEDAGLPIEDADIPEANKVLDRLYDEGIFLSYFPDKHMFVKGFDDVIRVTDFKNVEAYEEPIGKHNRKYI
jgi:phenylalanyl-tRNA synthetase beta subunit